jgi:hypothetical protein|tara:strand:- start:1432 stop:1623 length:192 start_codon:yes stop_codon:yes gene_type:complete
MHLRETGPPSPYLRGGAMASLPYHQDDLIPLPISDIREADNVRNQIPFYYSDEAHQKGSGGSI